MKALHILTDTNIGGAGRLLCNYLRFRNEALAETAVLLPENAAVAQYAAEYARVVFTHHGADKSFEIPAVSEYSRIFAEEKPDIVVTHSCMSARLAAKISGVSRKIYVRHCAYETGNTALRPPLYRFIRRTADDFLSDTVIATAEAARDKLIAAGVRAEKIITVQNGVAPLEMYDAAKRIAVRESLGYAADDFVFITAARLEPVKRIDCIIAAVTAAVRENPHLRLLIVGDGSCKADLEADVKNTGAQKYVSFTGFAPDVTPFYNAADATVNASVSETSPLAVSEGFSLGLPAVVTLADGNADMVRDGDNGYTVASDAKTLCVALAEKISALAACPDRYVRMSRCARDMYNEKFTAAAMAKKWDKIIFSAT